MTTHFGEHITIDGYGGDQRRLNSKQTVVSCIEKLCAELKMHPLSKVHVLSAPDNHIKDPGGWSAFLIIAESHISIHTFPKRGFLSADVYTCQNGLDVNFVVDFIKKKFHLKETEVNFIQRGLKYPQQNIGDEKRKLLVRSH